MTGRFITFEGGEGAGKSTQIDASRTPPRGARHRGRHDARARRLASAPSASAAPSCPAAQSRSAARRGAAVLGGAARPSRDDDPPGARARRAWCSATASPIRRAPTRARRAGSSRSACRALERIVVDATRPDLTFILDVPAEVGLARAAARRRARPRRPTVSRPSTSASTSACARLSCAIAGGEPERCVVIDATGPPDEVEEQVWAAVEAALSGPETPPRRRSAKPMPVIPRRPRAGPARRHAASARADGVLRPWRGRGGVPRCLRGRAPAPRLADRRPGGHRQGDARLSGRALPARPSGRRRAGGARRSTVAGDIRRRGRSRRCPIRICVVLRRAPATRTARAIAATIPSTRCAARSSFFGSTAAEGGCRICIVDAADDLNAAAPTRCSRSSRSRRRARCSCRQPCARAAPADDPLALPPAAAAPLAMPISAPSSAALGPPLAEHGGRRARRGHRARPTARSRRAARRCSTRTTSRSSRETEGLLDALPRLDMQARRSRLPRSSAARRREASTTLVLDTALALGRASACEPRGQRPGAGAPCAVSWRCGTRSRAPAREVELYNLDRAAGRPVAVRRCSRPRSARTS